MATTNGTTAGGHAVTLLQLRRLIEFYFSDSEIKSLYSRIAGIQDQNPSAINAARKDGWIPLSVIAGYSRVKKLSTNINVIVSAVQSSDTLELNGDCTSLRRRNAPSLLLEGLLDFSTIYVSELPLGIKDDELRSYFAAYGEILQIQIGGRKTTALIEFVNEDAAEQVMAQKHHYNGEEFRVQYKKILHIERNPPISSNVTRDRLKKRQRDASPSPHKSQTDAPVHQSASECVDLGYEPDCLLRVSNIEPAVRKGTLRQYFAEYGPIKAVSVDAGSKSAIIHYTMPLASQVHRVLFPDVNGCPIAKDKAFIRKFGKAASVSPLSGDQELKFYTVDKASKKTSVKAVHAKAKGGKGGKVKVPKTRRQGRPLRPVEKLDEASRVEGLHARIRSGEQSDSDVEIDPEASKKRRTLTKEEESKMDVLMNSLTTVAMV